MKVELHLHTTRYSGCATASPEVMMRALIDAGYDAVYITEHDATWSDRELTELRGRFPEIAIVPGVELSLESDHLLVLGTNDPRFLSMRSPADIIDAARADGHLTVLAHPFRWATSSDILDGDTPPDAMEFQTPNVPFDRAGLALVRAKAMSLPVVNSGDAHAVHFLDRFWVETFQPLDAGDDIRDIILDGAYVNRQAKNADDLQ